VIRACTILSQVRPTPRDKTKAQVQGGLPVGGAAFDGAHRDRRAVGTAPFVNSHPATENTDRLRVKGRFCLSATYLA
jgi:hypothetical protein